MVKSGKSSKEDTIFAKKQNSRPKTSKQVTIKDESRPTPGSRAMRLKSALLTAHTSKRGSLEPHLRRADASELGMSDQFATTLSGLNGEAVYHSNKHMRFSRPQSQIDQQKVNRLKVQERQGVKMKQIHTVMHIKVKNMVYAAELKHAPKPGEKRVKPWVALDSRERQNTMYNLMTT